MTPLTVGMYVLIAVGAAAIIAAIALAAAKRETRQWLLMAGFGFLVASVGTFGPSFMKDYADFLKTVASLQGAEKTEKVGAIVADFAAGRVPTEYRDLAWNVVLEHPSPVIHSKIKAAIANTPNIRPDDKSMLESMSKELARREETTRIRVKAIEGAPGSGGTLTPTNVAELDTLSLQILKGALEDKPDPAQPDRFILQPDTLKLLDKDALQKVLSDREAMRVRPR
jgi:membrane protein implicated in regulation of membrane protease activity